MRPQRVVRCGKYVSSWCKVRRAGWVGQRAACLGWPSTWYRSSQPDVPPNRSQPTPPLCLCLGSTLVVDQLTYNLSCLNLMTNSTLSISLWYCQGPPLLPDHLTFHRTGLDLKTKSSTLFQIMVFSESTLLLWSADIPPYRRIIHTEEQLQPFLFLYQLMLLLLPPFLQSHRSEPEHNLKRCFFKRPAKQMSQLNTQSTSILWSSNANCQYSCCQASTKQKTSFKPLFAIWNKIGTFHCISTRWSVLCCCLHFPFIITRLYQQCT